MATTHTIRTTFRPDVEITVDHDEYERLLDLGAIYDGTPPDPVADPFDARVADRINDNSSLTRDALDTLGVGGGSAPDATTTTKGIVQLAGDLAGTAAAPTVRGLAEKAPTASPTFTGTVSGVTKAHVGLGSVDNTSDSAKPVSTAQQAAIDAAKARANHTGTQPAATVSDLTEAVQDIVGAFIKAGTNTTVTYDDAANTFTINATASGGGTTDPEIVRDVIGGALVAGAGIQVTVNDAGDTITVASTAVLPTRKVTAGTGLTGGGDLSADRTLAVSYGTTAGTAAQGNDARLTVPALAPVQLKRATAGGSWTDASGTVYDNAARTALRPHPIYWLAAAGAEPTWGSNGYDANTTYGDIVNVTT